MIHRYIDIGIPVYTYVYSGTIGRQIRNLRYTKRDKFMRIYRDAILGAKIPFSVLRYLYPFILQRHPH